MSLFGTYIQEATSNDNDIVVISDINESSNELAYLTGEFMAEAAAFDILVDIKESVIPAVYNEAATDKIKAIKEKFNTFIQKAIDFFTDLIDRVKVNALGKLAKINKDAKIKRKVTLYKVEADKEYGEFNKLVGNKVSDLIHEAEKFSTEDTDASVAMKLANDDVKALADKFDDNHFAQYSQQFEVGTSVAQLINFAEKAKNTVSVNQDSIKLCNNLKKTYEKAAANKDEKFHSTMWYSKNAVELMNKSMEVGRKVNNKVIKNVGAIIVATGGKENPDKEQKQIAG